MPSSARSAASPAGSMRDGLAQTQWGMGLAMASAKAFQSSTMPR